MQNQHDFESSVQIMNLESENVLIKADATKKEG